MWTDHLVAWKTTEFLVYPQKRHVCCCFPSAPPPCGGAVTFTYCPILTLGARSRGSDEDIVCCACVSRIGRLRSREKRSNKLL
jgi:hypothetical protein